MYQDKVTLCGSNAYEKSLTALLQMNPTQARLIQENGEVVVVEVARLKNWGYIRSITWRPSTNRWRHYKRLNFD